MNHRALVFGAGVIVALILATAAQAQGTPKGDAAAGKKLFDTVGCFECHGWAGQGGGGGGGPKLINPPVFPAFIVQLRTPRQVMPPYTAKVLSDQQVADIYAYVQTFPKPRAVSTIPLLN